MHPLRDAETVETELMLADLESVERQLTNAVKRARGGDKEAKDRISVLEPAADVLREGKPARQASIPEDRKRLFRQLQLLTAKPVLYVANVEESEAATGNALSEGVVSHSHHPCSSCGKACGRTGNLFAATPA